MTCVMCGEDVVGDGVPIGTPTGMGVVHRECGLREVMGGIGHCVAHEYWCKQKNDPDAGLTYRQSALLVQKYYEVVGMPPE